MSLSGVNLSETNQEYVEVLHHSFKQCVCTGHTGVGHSLSIYIYIQDISKNFEFEKGSRDCNKK